MADEGALNVRMGTVVVVEVGLVVELHLAALAVESGALVGGGSLRGASSVGSLARWALEVGWLLGWPWRGVSAVDKEVLVQRGFGGTICTTSVAAKGVVDRGSNKMGVQRTLICELTVAGRTVKSRIVGR